MFSYGDCRIALHCQAAQYMGHGIGCLTLGGGGDVGVGVQGEAGGVVAQHTADRFHIYAILERQGSEGVSQIMEPHLGQPCSFQYPVEHMENAVRGNGAACGRREYIFAVPLFFLLY